jgi:hypothetical protein
MLILIVLLLSATAAARPQQPDTVVRELYSYIVTHRPLGIPCGADKAALWPLLSSRLIRELDAARACEDDYRRQHASDDGKPAFGWLESGLFSGSDERALPSEVAVERTEPQRDGSFGVYVRFTYRESAHGRPPDPSAGYHWRGAAIVRSEAGRFVVDDVLLFKDESTNIESRLSQVFVGCDGPRWVGH